MDSGTYSGYGEVNGMQSEKMRLKQDKGQFVSTLSKIQETPVQSTNVGTISNGSAENKEDANQDNR